MSLLGRGVVAIWNDIRPEGRADFYAWHEQEHIPERVAVPGFLRGRRYIALEAEIEFFTLYETAGPEVLAGEAYLERLNNPTDWTRRAVRHFYNVTRGLTDLGVSTGRADGGVLLAAAFDLGGDAGRAEPIAAAVAEIGADRELCGAHFALTDLAASNVETAERRGRDNANVVPEAVVLIEASRPELHTSVKRRLDRLVEVEAGTSYIRRPGIYRLEFELLSDSLRATP